MGMSPSDAGRLGYLKTKEALLEHVKDQILKSHEKCNGKKCKGCGCLLPYEKRRNTYCDHRCAAIISNKGRTKEKFCRNCRTPMKKGQSKFCSSKCCNDNKYKEYISRWLRREERGGSWFSVSKPVRRWMGETQGEKCAKCGWCEKNSKTGKVPVQVNHKDGNPENHRPENLELLCPNCHSLTPNFGGLNRGRGRKQRYAKAGVV